jgi:trehalose 6-phosphate phosphatase
MSARTRKLLDSLAKLYPCVIVSGRGRTDLARKMSGVKVARLIGNHGAETEGTRAPLRRIARWKAALERELGDMPGVWIEDKGFSLAVHYRLFSQKATARRRIPAAAGKLKQARVMGGKEVINVVMDGAPRKGDAVATERDRLKCDWVLYVGDDENDEDAFEMEGNVAAVRIGRKKRSRAKYYLRNQGEMDDLLALLAWMRRPVGAGFNAGQVQAT